MKEKIINTINFLKDNAIKLNFFYKKGIIKLSHDSKIEISQKIRDDLNGGNIYWIQVFLSSIIAALWLLQNSVAVVIGAMLIAPMLRPINWISFSISKWERALFLQSIKILFLSIFTSILMWYLSAKIIGFSTETTEILSRVSPNILDLFIAIFSAVVAILSLWYKKMWLESIAWVAMAASLMPPLEIVWIELSLKNYYFAYWAIMLFLANLVSIILVWVIIFWLYWFTPNSWDKQKTSFETFTFIVLIMVIISVPLFQSLFTIKQKAEIMKNSKNYLENILQQENSLITVSSIWVKYISKNNIVLDSVVKLPEWIDFYDTFKEQLDFELSKKLGKNIDLNIELIRTANIISSWSINNTENKIYDFISNEFEISYNRFNLISLEIKKQNFSYNIKIIFWVKEKNFDIEIFSDLENKVKSVFWGDIKFELIPLSISENKFVKEIEPLEQQKIDIVSQFNDYMKQNLLPWIKMRSISIDSINSFDKLQASLSFEVNNKLNLEYVNFISSLKSFADSLNIWLDIKTFRYDEINL